MMSHPTGLLVEASVACPEKQKLGFMRGMPQAASLAGLFSDPCRHRQGLKKWIEREREGESETQGPIPPNNGEWGGLGPGPRADSPPTEGRKEERERAKVKPCRKKERES